MGKRSTIIYLVTLIISSIALALLLDVLWTKLGVGIQMHQLHQHQLLPKWLQWSAAFFLLVLLLFPPIFRALHSLVAPAKQNVKTEVDMQTVLKVPNMSCNNCVTHIRQAVVEVQGVENVDIDLKSKRVSIHHQHPIAFEKIKEAIEKAGYEVSDIS